MSKILFLNLAALLIVIGTTQNARSQITPEQYSQANDDFKAFFQIGDDGQVRRRAGVKLPSEISSTVDDGVYSAYLNKKDGSTAWYVGSRACSQNKEFTCLSVYNQNDVKAKGNSQNPFGTETRSGDYTLYRMNTKDPKQSSVVSCSDTKLMVNTVRDDASLKNCTEYSKNSCNEWMKVVNEDPALTGDLEKNEAMCKDLLSRGEKLRAKMRNIFQSNLKDLSKEIGNNFDKATSQNGGLRVTTDAKVETDATSPVKLNSNVLLIKDVIKRTDDCARYINVFDGSTTKEARAARIRDLYSDSDSSNSSSSKKSKGKASKVKTNN
ncbi:MAG: hypothetical protein H7256_07865 [Bdellovibrio sp.]|nr:hypothetical protein [Bdellovibrio sp.]